MKWSQASIDGVAKLAREGRAIFGNGPAILTPAAAGTPPDISEEDFTAAAIELAQRHGWKVIHIRPARTLKGWRTPISGDGKGFVDLVCVRERVVWIELKTEVGELEPEQQDWQRWLLDARQEHYVIRPSDWPKLQQILE